jgi:hypothetical protein
MSIIVQAEPTVVPREALDRHVQSIVDKYGSESEGHALVTA